MQVDNLQGIFSWKDQVIDYMKKYTKGTVDFKNVNIKLVDSLHLQYLKLLSIGYPAPVPEKMTGDRVVSWKKPGSEMLMKIVTATGIDLNLISLFFSALYFLSKSGKIDFKKYNPVEAEKAKEIIYKNIPSEKPGIKKIGDIVTGGFKIGLPLLLIGGAAAAFLYYQTIKRGIA